jgi:predicted flap endonuclease-1-like 5' DNA nuclease
MSARASAAESPVTPAEGPHSETPSALHPPADDDLERIRGIGPTIARRLRAHGVRSYRDIMEWSDADLARVAAAIRAPLGRVRRDHWPEQARDLELQKPGVAVPA